MLLPRSASPTADPTADPAAGPAVDPVAGLPVGLDQVSPGPAAGLPRRLALRTRDGQVLPAWHRVAADGSRLVGLVLAHGFGFGGARDELAALATRLTAVGGVLSFDFRGHGGATGFSTVGDLEALDVDAAVAALRQLGYLRVVTVGFSMGGSAVLRHAGLSGGLTEHPPDAVATVSTGARWFCRDTPALRRLGWLVGTRAGRLALRLAWGVRVSPAGWQVVPASPAEVVGRIAVPLLLVHGEADACIPVLHVRELAAASGGHARVRVLAGFGHAELAVTPAVAEALVSELARLVGELSQPPGELSQPPGELSQPPGELSQPSGELSQPPAEATQPSGRLRRPGGGAAGVV